MESTDDFDVSEKKSIMAKAYMGYPEYKIEVCPDCVDHPQLDNGEMNRLSKELDTELDCKNLFLKDGKVVDQCCCYSIVHCIGFKDLTWYCQFCSGIVKKNSYGRWVCSACGTQGDGIIPSHAKPTLSELAESLPSKPMTWFCDKCAGCNVKLSQNQKPTKSDCPQELDPTWYAKRWLKPTTPNPDYPKWLQIYGTEADKILWDQEKKDRGVK